MSGGRAPAAPSPLRERRLAVVTGAASGVGLASAHALLDRGLPLVGVDVAEAPPSLAHDERVAWVRGDVAAAGTWARVLETAAARDRRGADCLVACAATLVVGSFIETTAEDLARLFDVNAVGVVRGMQALLPGMLEQGRGAIAVACSVDSLWIEGGLGAYGTSKAALLAAVRSAALEHARDGVQINAVCPGSIDTPLFRRHMNAAPDPPAELRAVERRTPRGRILDPREVADVLCFLLSDAASGLSGAAVTVDGGLTSTYDYAGW